MDTRDFAWTLDSCVDPSNKVKLVRRCSVFTAANKCFTRATSPLPAGEGQAEARPKIWTHTHTQSKVCFQGYRCVSAAVVISEPQRLQVGRGHSSLHISCRFKRAFQIIAVVRHFLSLPSCIAGQSCRQSHVLPLHCDFQHDSVWGSSTQRSSGNNLILP